jgi:3-oxoacyl-[acyl-carrier protein] reductase
MVRNVPEEKLNQLIQQQAIRRFTTNRDIANAIDFFLQKESDFITGQVMYLGGV